MRAAGVAIALLGVGAVGVAPASAATKNYPYSKSQRFWSAPLARCINVTLSGTISVDVNSYKGTVMSWKKPKLVNPSMRVGVGNKCAAGDKAATLSKLKIAQAWYRYDCSVGVSISAGGYPWAASVTPTVHCGNESVGKRESEYGAGNIFQQSSSGSPIYWNNTAHATTLCLDAYVAGTAYVGNHSDDFTINNYKICVKP